MVVSLLLPQQVLVADEGSVADGVLSLDISRALTNGALHGVDSSPAMIEAARKAAAEKGLQDTSTFEGTSFQQ